MARIKPYRGESINRLRSLVRLSQKPALPIGVNLAFGALSEGISEEHNTSVMTTATDVNNKSTEKKLIYKRLDVYCLNWLPPGELLPYANIKFPTTTHAILSIINEALGINLKTSEVVNEPIPSIPPNGIQLKIAAGSYAWIEGEALFIYTPNAPAKAARSLDRRIPVSLEGRIRVLKS